MALTSNQRSAINFIEQEYHLNGGIPTYETFSTKFTDIPRATWERWFRDDDFITALDRRGITANLQYSLGGNGVLSERQLAAVNTVLDFRDKKSVKSKLSALGVSTQEYEAWLRDPAFQNYLRQRAEKVLDGNMAHAHQSLLNAIDKGDIRAVTLYYEMTGRWSSKTVGELNVQFVFERILEIIQTHVKDTNVLLKIAEDMESLGVAVQPGALSNSGPLAALPVGVGVGVGFDKVPEIIDAEEISGASISM